MLPTGKGRDRHLHDPHSARRRNLRLDNCDGRLLRFLDDLNLMGLSHLCFGHGHLEAPVPVDSVTCPR